MDCEKILKLFQSELAAGSAGPRLFSKAPGRRSCRPVAGGGGQVQAVLAVPGGLV